MLHGLNAGLVGQISSNFIKKKMNTILTKCRDSHPGPLNPKVTYTAPLVALLLPETLKRCNKNGKNCSVTRIAGVDQLVVVFPGQKDILRLQVFLDVRKFNLRKKGVLLNRPNFELKIDVI